LVRLG